MDQYVDMDFSNLSFEVEISHTPDFGGSIQVDTFVRGTDLQRVRTMGYSMSLCDRKMKLALRLKKAIEAGKVFAGPYKARLDVHDQTFLEYNTMVHGKTMNADLKRLGF